MKLEDEGRELWKRFKPTSEESSMDLNDLAALIDGSVTGDERDRLEAEMVRDEEALDHYLALRRAGGAASSDTVRFLRKERGPASPVRRTLEWLATAAAFVLAATVGFYAGQGTQDNLAAAAWENTMPMVFGQGLLLMEEETSEEQL